MFSNYCKTAFRNLVRNKKFSLFNISGLAIGIASSILIFKFPGTTTYTPGTPYPALDAIRIKFPQMTTSVIYANYSA